MKLAGAMPKVTYKTTVSSKSTTIQSQPPGIVSCRRLLRSGLGCSRGDGMDFPHTLAMQRQRRTILAASHLDKIRIPATSDYFSHPAGRAAIAVGTSCQPLAIGVRG